MKTLSKAIALASLVSATALTAQVANAEVEVSASAAVSNRYLWRGLDLGSPAGTAAVSGGVSAYKDGAYAGIWASSGDVAEGNEYDLYAGYGLEAGGVEIDASIWTYVYPSGASDTMFDLTELVVSASVKGASVTLYETLTGNASDYRYVVLGYGMDKFSATLGLSMSDDEADDYTHVDFGYAHTDNLSFTVSQVIDQKTDGVVNNNAKVVATLSLPIE
jgi:uncharacterized protein (TIGR02001 family)